MTTGRINQVTTFARKLHEQLYSLKHNAVETQPKFSQCMRLLRYQDIRQDRMALTATLHVELHFAQSIVLLHA